MNFLINIFLFCILFPLYVFYYLNALGPLLWLPYVIIKILKGDLKFSAIFCCLIAPISWHIVLFIIAIIMCAISINFVYKLLEFINTHWGFFIANIFAIFNVLLKICSIEAQKEFKELLINFKTNK